MLNQEPEKQLPKLRSDLKLIESSPMEDGTKQWMLFDPIANKYYTIGIDSFDLLSHWEEGMSYSEFIKDLDENDYEIDEEGLTTFVNFLVNSGLTQTESLEDIKRLYYLKKNSKQSIFKWLIHNYLFIRIPLLKPDKWLNKHMHHANFFYSSLWGSIMFFIGLIGILLVIRDFDRFSSTFMYFFSKEGLLYYGISLMFVKSIHELGHAFTAKRYGCKIPSMGLAFLVLMPVLYTDTTNAHELKSKYKRLRIAVAGMKAELYLALIATFLWSFLPEGPLKSIAFIIATTSWITSLLINISPFLRFDGYYVLADITNTKNLQPRSFAMAKWFMRYYILGVEEEEPEYLPLSRKRFFILYAIATWIYRFFLFLGIAFLVYHFAFKLLGIILFVVEISFFIALPIYKELKIWFERRAEVKLNSRNKVSAVAVALLLIFFFIPWNTNLRMPAVLQVKNLTEIYTPKNGMIKEIFVQNNTFVKKGTPLLKIESEKLNFSIQKSKLELEALLLNYQRVAANTEVLHSSFVLQESIAKKRQELANSIALKDSLTLNAPFNGIVTFNTDFKIGQYINTKESILTLFDPKTPYVISFINDIEYENLQIGAEGTFIPSIPFEKSLDVKVSKISKVSLSAIPYKELTSAYGGGIATREEAQTNQENLISEDAYFKIESEVLDKNLTYSYRVDGELIAQSRHSSLATRSIQFLYNILIKESGF